MNSAPFEGGWLFKVRVAQEPDDLLSADEYTAFSGKLTYPRQLRPQGL